MGKRVIEYDYTIDINRIYLSEIGIYDEVIHKYFHKIKELYFPCCIYYKNYVNLHIR